MPDPHRPSAAPPGAISAAHPVVRIAAAAAIAAALAACGGAGPDDDSVPSARNAAAPAPAVSDPPARSDPREPANGSSAVPVGEDDMAWHFSRTSRGPKLVYGERRTDNVRLMLRCPPGGDSVVLSFIRPADLVRRRPAEIEVGSGGAANMLTLDSRESQLGGRTVEAVAPIDLPPLQRFRAGSPLELRWGPETIRLPAGGAQQDEIRTFFGTCGPTG